MEDPVDALLQRFGGVATRAQLCTAVTRGRLDHLMRTGQLTAPYRGALCRPWDADLPSVRWRAALTSIGPPAALSHLTGLEMWGLLDQPGDAAVHVTAPYRRAPSSQRLLQAHRARRFPDVARLDGLIVVTAADAVVTSWPLIPRADRRGPAIRAVRERTTSTGLLRESFDRYGEVCQRRALGDLIALLEAGCQSELEIWGHLHVFDAAGLRHGIKQRTVHAGGRRYRLDVAYETERVVVELDGWEFHGTREQRERDLRRDAALAAAGWLTVRFTHRRLTTDAEGCRRELRAILATRSRM